MTTARIARDVAAPSATMVRMSTAEVAPAFLSGAKLAIGTIAL